MSDPYQQLAEYLDRLPAGFPRSASGVELRILRKLFTPEQAALALHLSLIEAEARVIARRARLPLAETEPMLEEMARKGLISVSHPPGRAPRYAASQYVIGFWEGQVNHLDREIVDLQEEYLPTLVNDGPWKLEPQLRTVPVGATIPVERGVLPYERADEILRGHQHFAVSPCVCRQEQELKGEGCGKPSETCLTLGATAQNLARLGRSREITKDEALELLKQADQAGLVLQPANSQDPMVICMCCGCCCGVLRSIKRWDNPSEHVSNPFIAQLEPALCSGCGKCVTRCPMEALTMAAAEGGRGKPKRRAEHNPRRCIGCGLCVSTCPTGALSMVRKPPAAQPYIPHNTTETYLRLGWLRDPRIVLRLLGEWVRAQVERVTGG